MPKITYKINPKRFEIVRDQIASILADELANQALLQTDPDLIQLLQKAKIVSERMRPAQENELPMLDVYMFNSDLQNQHPGTHRGIYDFHIDLFAGSKSNGTDNADKRSAIKAHSLIGLIQEIFMSPHYVRLGFDPSDGNKFVEGSHLVATRRMEEENTRDAMGVIMYRLILRVRLNEQSTPLAGTPIGGQDTGVKISTTDLGFEYIYNAT